MTSETAPNAMTNANKRVRIEAPTSIINDPPSTLRVSSTNQSPKGCALTSVSTFVVTLRRHLSPIVKKAAESHMDLLHKLMSKMIQYEKMDDDSDFIPRSARLVNFEFRVTKKVENSPEFLAIQADTDTLVQEFRQALKQKIRQTLKIEIDLLRTEFYEHLCTSFHLVVQAFLITEQAALDPHKVVSTMTHYYFKDMWDQLDLELEEFYKVYKTTHALETFPFPIDDLAPATEDEALDMDEENNREEASTTRLTSIKAKTLIVGAFANPVLAYFTRIEEIKVDISLKKLHTSNTLEEATDATATRLDAEVSVNNDLLEDIIQKKVAARTKNLLSEIGQLKKQMATLNKGKGTVTPPTTKKDRRGQPTTTPGASILKKKSTRAPKPKDNAQKAAVPAKGTTRRPKGKKGNLDARKKRRPQKK